MAEWAPSNIDIIGGEPLLRIDCVLSILKEVVKTNYIVTLVTNENVAQLMPYLSCCNHNIQISLEGTEKSFSNVNYCKVMDGIANVSRVKLNFGFNMTIYRCNLDDFEETIWASTYNS